MKFDVVIIGGGIAGLTCGITLQSQGKRCAIINNGQAALDFSSGSMDLLANLNNGENVQNLHRTFDQLIATQPQHPYVILGKEKVFQQAQKFEKLAEKLGFELVGDSSQNHWRVTPLGGLKASWLSPKTVPTVAMNETFPHKHIAVLGIEGYQDFQPQLLAENLRRQTAFAHCEIIADFLHLPVLDKLRQLSREFRSVHIAQALAQNTEISNIAYEIKRLAKNATAVFLPACFGLENNQFFQQLQQATGLSLFELPTLPPSLLGHRQHQVLKRTFEQAGGLMFNGDRALKAEYDNNQVCQIFTQLHENEPIMADHFILASGGFFSNGLVAEFEEIYEPLFHADMYQSTSFIPQDRLSWTNSRFAKGQPFQEAGVVINQHCQAQKCGVVFDNLYAIGSVVGGYNGVMQGCGTGVAVITALTVADHILQQ